MSPSTFIHIGFPKCASTSLQRDLFLRCPHIDFVGRNDDWNRNQEGGHRYILQLATLDNPHYWEIKDEVARNIESCFSGDERQVRVVSDELFVSAYRPHMSGIPVMNLTSVAERLRDLFPGAQILMVIRDQVSFWNSMLAQLMENNRIVVDVDFFFESHKEYAEMGCGSFFTLADYNAVYELYASMFGRDRVHVLLLEDLVRSPHDFMAHLMDLWGLSEEVDLDRYSLGRHNTRNRQPKLLAQYPGVFKRLKPLRKVIPRAVEDAIRSRLKKVPSDRITAPEQIEYIRRYYAPGNRALAEATGLDLAARGYPMGDD